MLINPPCSNQSTLQDSIKEARLLKLSVQVCVLSSLNSLPFLVQFVKSTHALTEHTQRQRRKRALLAAVLTGRNRSVTSRHTLTSGNYVRNASICDCLVFEVIWQQAMQCFFFSSAALDVWQVTGLPTVFLCSLQALQQERATHLWVHLDDYISAAESFNLAVIVEWSLFHFKGQTLNVGKPWWVFWPMKNRLNTCRGTNFKGRGATLWFFPHSGKSPRDKPPLCIKKWGSVLHLEQTSLLVPGQQL